MADVDPVRARALEILKRVDADSAYVDRLLSEVSRNPQWSQLDLSFLEQVVKGTLKRRAALDAELKPLITCGWESLTPWVRNILRLGAYQLHYLDRVPKQAAVNESVRLAKHYGHRGVAGLVNAVLRRLARSEQMLVSDDCSAQAVATRGSHPLWLVERWIEQFGKEATIELCEANNRPAPLTIRTNTLHITSDELRERLSTVGVQCLSGRYDSDCTLIQRLPGGLRFTELEAFKAGLFMVQDESSGLAVRLLDPQPGEKILDLCAAPGGKTMQIAFRMQGAGRILAVDPASRRLDLVRQNAVRLGVTNIDFCCVDGRQLELQAPVDRVLVDAPCSGTGVLGRKVDARWRKRVEDFEQLTKLQMALLDHATGLVKVGGVLVYSTCSVDRAENQDVIIQFLKAYTQFRLESAIAYLPSQLVTAEGWVVAFPPHHQMGGAFAARLVRVA